MAVKITAVASPKPGQGATLEVPQDVKDDIDAIYAHLTANPGTEGFAEFDTDEEVQPWLKFARAYATSREAGALKFRQLPSKHLPANQIRFSLTADLQANGERNGQPGPVSPPPVPPTPASTGN
jgi:hypothetical protein